MFDFTIVVFDGTSPTFYFTNTSGWNTSSSKIWELQNPVALRASPGVKWDGFYIGIFLKCVINICCIPLTASNCNIIWTAFLLAVHVPNSAVLHIVTTVKEQALIAVGWMLYYTKFLRTLQCSVTKDSLLTIYHASGRTRESDVLEFEP